MTSLRALLFALAVLVVGAQSAHAALPAGFIGNSQLCPGAAGVTLYKADWRFQFGPGGLEAVPSDLGSPAAERLTTRIPLPTLPTVLNAQYVRVGRFANHELKLNFAKASDLCVARVSTPQQAVRYAGGRRIPALRFLDRLPADQLRAAVEHLTHIPAAAQDAFAARGAFGSLTAARDLGGVPAYVDLASYPAWSSLLIMQPGQAAGVEVGPDATFGFGASVAYESDTNSTVLHEFGHVYDMATNRSLTTDWASRPFAEAASCAAKVADNPSYAASSGGEWYAESFAIYLLNPQRNAALRQACPVTWSYHRATVGLPSF